MENEPINLNTEENDIAGNRIDGPVGNTATKPLRPGMGTGQPGGPPTPAEAPVTSKELAEAETSPGKGAVGPEIPPQENKEADPEDLKATGAYGGNFGNSTQGSFNDQARLDNQASDASRGEFGVQDPGGTTHGGFGNQNRTADYEPRNSAEDQYYGGPGAPGPQDNAYRAYDGHDERPDSRTEYGFEAGVPPVSPSTTNANQNDNGARPGPDGGYAKDYGQTSLRALQDSRTNPEPATGQRNQTDEYRPTPGNSQPQPDASADQPTNLAGTPSPRSAGAEQPAPDERTGYVQAPGGDTAQGLGSRGGSYNDAYDDSRPGSTAGSPAPGDQRSEDTARNYGEAAREENRAADEENEADHGAPHRNAGRDQ